MKAIHGQGTQSQLSGDRLKEALENIKLVYAKDYLNKVPKAVMAAHMGYKGLSGASLPILAALNQYGLLDGRGEMRLVPAT